MHILIRKSRTLLRMLLHIPPSFSEQQFYGQTMLLMDGSNYTSSDDEWLRVSTQHAKIFFDVGANIGHTALLGLLSKQVDRIVLVEPNPAALAIAAQHLVLNNLSMKAQFMPVALTSMPDQTLRLWTVGTGSAGSIYQNHAKTAAKKGSYIQVSTMTFDTLCDFTRLTPDFAKIDVEGAEVEVLKGAVQCAQTRMTRFLVEVHGVPISLEKNIEDIMDWCKQNGYTAWHLGQGCPLSDLQDIAIIYKSPNRHILLQPDDWDYPEWFKTK